MVVPFRFNQSQPDEHCQNTWHQNNISVIKTGLIECMIHSWGHSDRANDESYLIVDTCEQHHQTNTKLPTHTKSCLDIDRARFHFRSVITVSFWHCILHLLGAITNSDCRMARPGIKHRNLYGCHTLTLADPADRFLGWVGQALAEGPNLPPFLSFSTD